MKMAKTKIRKMSKPDSKIKKFKIKKTKSKAKAKVSSKPLSKINKVPMDELSEDDSFEESGDLFSDEEIQDADEYAGYEKNGMESSEDEAGSVGDEAESDGDEAGSVGDGAESDEDEEGSDGDEAVKHKKDLERLRETDPDFYQFLQENDKKLLQFNLSDDESDELEPAEKLHQPTESLEVASDESDFEVFLYIFFDYLMYNISFL